jgi:hypothetical protein
MLYIWQSLARETQIQHTAIFYLWLPPKLLYWYENVSEEITAFIVNYSEHNSIYSHALYRKTNSEH